MIETDVQRLTPSEFMSWLEIDLAAVSRNYAELRSRVAPGADLFPVVKADAYGHGAVEVARTLIKNGAKRLCVARAEEAIELRTADISCSILVFAPPFYEQACLAARYSLEVVVCDPEHISAVKRAQDEFQKVIPVHVKTDVGMGRIGMPPARLLSFLNQCDADRISVIGVMSHFPCADAPDTTLTIPMIQKFRSVMEQVKASGRSGLIFHTANTAALLRFPTSHCDAVRSGISLYGQYPDVTMDRNILLVPAMSLFTRIIYIKDVPADTPISYCQGYRTTMPSRIATLALGYADGLPRHATGKASCVVNGQSVQQVGRICMDQTMIDITNVPEAAIGDRVLIFGSYGKDVLRAEDVASKFDTIGYELTTRIGKRLPRLYKEN